MYIRDCHIENVGPIQSFDLQFPFDDHGSPKPVVLLGENGTGKSTILSMLADALALIQQRVYEDVVLGQTPNAQVFFRVAGNINQRFGTPYSLSLLRLGVGDASAYWVEKTGQLSAAVAKERFGDRFGPAFPWNSDEGVHKSVQVGIQQQALSADFRRNSYCYFPSDRGEEPSWLNGESISPGTSFGLERAVEGRLHKPLYIHGAMDGCLPWLLDVILDARSDVVVEDDGRQRILDGSPNELRRRSQLQVAVIVQVIREVLGNDDVRLGVAPRANRLFRLHVTDHENPVMPSLACLSAGQASLLGIFATILRYSDTEGAGIGAELDKVHGIVLIDEADAHLHTRLQYRVLPLIIKSLPNVQFVITSHSPTVLLGMEQQLGSDGFIALEMPDGVRRTSDDYPEVSAAVQCLTETETFRNIVSAKLAEKTQLPRVFLEGETDVKYVRKAFEVLDHAQTLSRVDISSFSHQTPQGSVDGGCDMMDKLADCYLSTPKVFPVKVLLLYDSDARKGRAEGSHGSLTIQFVPQNASSVITKGIENLLPQDVFASKYYSSKQSVGPYLDKHYNETLDKVKLCDDLCAAANPSIFEVFRPIIGMIETWLGQ